MKTLLLLLFLIAPQVQSIEILVKAQPFWQRGKEIPTVTLQDSISYLRDMWHQTHRGEIIVIKPDGWGWGRKERPPEYIVVKVPGVTVAQAIKYTQGLIDSTLYDSSLITQPDTVDVKERRWHFLKKVVDSALVLWSVDSSFVVLTANQAKTVVKEYDLAVIKQKIRDRLRQ